MGVALNRLLGAGGTVLLLVGLLQRSGLAAATPPPAQATMTFTGPMPDPAGTPCPGEDDPTRHAVVPPHITIPGSSVRYFLATNPQPFGVALVVFRDDGGVAMSFPAVEHLDDGMRAMFLGFSKLMSVIPPIPGCAHQAGIMVMRFTVPGGDVTMFPFPPPSGGVPAPTPTPTP